MGTRAVTIIREYDAPMCAIYTQCDGYIGGLGMEIKEILNDGDVRIGNGIGSMDFSPKTFNGMGCLAAYLIGKLKGEEIGHTYMCHIPDEEEYEEQEYLYVLESDSEVTGNYKYVNLTVLNYGKEVYKGPLEELQGNEDFDKDPEDEE